MRNKEEYLDELKSKLDFKQKIRDVKNKYKLSGLYPWILTYTKKVIMIVLVITYGNILITMISLLFAFFVNKNPESLTLMVTLSQTLSQDTGVIILGYLAKALLETKFEKDLDYKEKHSDINTTIVNENINEDINNNDNSKDL